MNVDENTAEFATTLRDFCLCLPFEERLVFIDIVERVRSAACTAPIGALRLIIADALRGLGRQLEEDEKMTNDNQQSRAALAPEKKQQIRDAKGRVCPFCGGPMYYHPPTDVFACTMANCPMKSSYPIQGQGVVMNTGIESFNAELSLKWMPMLYGCELYIDFNGRHLRIGYVEQEVGSWKWWCAPDEIGFAASPDAAQEEILSTLGISRSSKDE